MNWVIRTPNGQQVDEFLSRNDAVKKAIELAGEGAYAWPENWSGKNDDVEVGVSPSEAQLDATGRDDPHNQPYLVYRIQPAA